MSVKATAAVVVVAAVLMAGASHDHRSAPVHGGRQAIAYARDQLGKPYEWGGIGPDAFDCSGLTMQAWASAGVSIPRTAAEQFAQEPRVSEPRPGDEVFFAGADGTPSEPGHVGLVIGRHLMIEAYATGYPIRISHFGTASSPPGDGDPVGYADPGER